ncbi:Elongation factor 1 beta [Aphelenchoides fujianensis]|nr:Elongation factor 1 beta [Aphelenchoides fujianensis]
MSDTALLSEVRANLPYRLALKAADQVFSGDRLLYTNVSAEHVHRGHGGGGGRRHRTSTHQSEHHAGGRGGGGHSALDEAKNIVDESLKKTHRGGKGRNSRNRRSTSGDGDLTALRSKVEWLVDENEKLHEEVASLRELVEKLAGTGISGGQKEGAAPAAAKKEEKPAAATEKAEAKDEDFDLFGSDEEEDDAEKERVLPIAYGINKLQIMCVVEDDKVSSDDLEEKITDMEDYVQSIDVVAFNKV